MGKERNQGSEEEGSAKCLYNPRVTSISCDIAYGGQGATFTHHGPGGHSGPIGGTWRMPWDRQWEHF